MVELSEIYFHPSSGWEMLAELVPAQRVHYDHRNKLCLQTSHHLHWTYAILPLAWTRRHLSRTRSCSFIASPSAPRLSPQRLGMLHTALLLLPAPLTQQQQVICTGRLLRGRNCILATNGKGFCKVVIIQWKNWGLSKRQILTLPSTGGNPIFSISVAVSEIRLSYKHWRKSPKSYATKSCAAERPFLALLSPNQKFSFLCTCFFNLLKPTASSFPPWLSSAAAGPPLPGLSPLVCPARQRISPGPRFCVTPHFIFVNADVTEADRLSQSLLRPMYCRNRTVSLWSICVPCQAVKGGGAISTVAGAGLVTQTESLRPS